MKKVLIITSKNDEHADYIINLMNIRGLADRVIRLNAEDFRENVIYSFDGKKFRIKILDSGKEFVDTEICTVWYRRPIKNKVICDDLGVRKFIEKQIEQFVNGLYYCMSDTALWINDLRANLFAKNKIYQLHMAEEVGFLIPKVVISNNESVVREFVCSNDLICNKSLSEPHYEYGGKEYPYMTRMVKKGELLNNISSLNVCPTLFEEFIVKKYDIRVVVFGEKVYAFAIYSQEKEMSKVDVRGLSPLLLKHEYIELPKEIEDKIRLFMKKQNLFFSSIDLMYSVDEKYYFVENNCNGQWLWLENMTGKNMSSSFINIILRECE